MKKTAQENILMVPATLVPVITDIAAEAGDHLMIINNVCVGVFTGKLPSSPAKQVVADATPQRAANQEPKQPSKPRTTRSKKDMVSPATVLKVIRQQQAPIGAREVGDAIGLERSDLNARGRVSRFLALLVKEGKIVNVAEAGKIQTYALNPENQ